MYKDELNEREFIKSKKNYYWHATDEYCSIDNTMSKDELNEREFIQGKKNYYWNVIDYYSSRDNTMNKDKPNEKEYIHCKKNHYWHASDDCSGRVHSPNLSDGENCNSERNVLHTETTSKDEFITQLKGMEVQLQNEVIVPLQGNVVSTKNFQKVLELASGEFIDLNGDRDVIFLPGGSNFFSDYKNINDKEKFLYSNLKRMYMQLEILKNNSKYSVINGPVEEFDSTSTLFSGYNVIEVFMKKYIDILYSLEGNGLTSSEIKYQKHFLLFLLLPFIRWAINSNIPISSDRTIELFTEYYWDEAYFEEKLVELKSILDLKI